MKNPVKITHFLFFVISILILLSGFTAFNSSSKIVVTDFNHPVELHAGRKNSQNKIVRLKLKITSNIDEPIGIDLKNGDQLVQEIYLGPGATETFLVDWYTNHAEIFFKKISNKSRSIEIEYGFLEI